MEIPGYKYIQHNIAIRPWGVECQFTVIRDEWCINDIAMLSGEKADEKEIVEAITARLLAVDNYGKVQEEQDKIYTASEVKSILVSKGYLTEAQKIEDLQTKAEVTAEARK